ncbi:hypothetical protein MW925_003894 [Salmonella enterica]|nr:hypothetical protein [Salmonella enterica]ELW8655760.1 hypothetical protein [Salmonella enterica]
MRTRMVVINEKQGAVEVDCKIVNLVIDMNNSGFVTFASCQGHEFPVDIIKPYIAFRAPVEIVARLERNLREDIESLNGKLNWFWSINASFNDKYELVYSLAPHKPFKFIHKYWRKSLEQDFQTIQLLLRSRAGVNGVSPKTVVRNQKGCAIFSESFVPDNLYCDQVYGSSIFSVCKEFVHESFSVLMRSGREVLCWLIWTVKYGVVLPLMTMIIFVVFLFWQADMTPGQIMVRDIENAKAGTGAGEFLVHKCPPPPQTHPGRPELPVADLKNSEGCPVVVTDAAGYADWVNTSLRDWLATVWLTLALMFTVPGVFRGVIRGRNRF